MVVWQKEQLRKPGSLRIGLNIMIKYWGSLMIGLKHGNGVLVYSRSRVEQLVQYPKLTEIVMVDIF
jgi:hypothetical protein